MTPGKLFALEDERVRTLELYALPMDKLAWIYVNANRDPGEKDEQGNWKRQPAEAIPLEKFLSYRRKKDGSLAAKEDGWDHSLQGAHADREAFEAWGQVRSGVIFVPTKGD